MRDHDRRGYDAIRDRNRTTGGGGGSVMLGVLNILSGLFRTAGRTGQKPYVRPRDSFEEQVETVRAARIGYNRAAGRRRHRKLCTQPKALRRELRGMVRMAMAKRTATPAPEAVPA